MGLLDPLDNDANRSGLDEDRSGAGRGVVGTRSGVVDQEQSQAAQGEDGEPVGVNANAYIGENASRPSLALVVKESSCAR